MQHLQVSCAVRRFFKSLGFKGLIPHVKIFFENKAEKYILNRKRGLFLPYNYRQVWKTLLQYLEVFPKKKKTAMIKLNIFFLKFKWKLNILLSLDLPYQLYVGALRHCCVFYRHNGDVTPLDYKILILSEKCHWLDKITILYEKQCYIY